MIREAGSGRLEVEISLPSDRDSHVFLHLALEASPRLQVILETSSVDSQASDDHQCHLEALDSGKSPRRRLSQHFYRRTRNKAGA
jgi:hypothetical protein